MWQISSDFTLSSTPRLYSNTANAYTKAHVVKHTQRKFLSLSSGLCFAVYFSPSLLFCLTIFYLMPLFLSLSISILIYLILSLVSYIYVWFFYSLSSGLCFSLYFSPSLSFCLFPFLYFANFFSFSISVFLSRSLSFCLSIHYCLFPYLCLFPFLVYLILFLRLPLYFFSFISLYFSLPSFFLCPSLLFFWNQEKSEVFQKLFFREIFRLRNSLQVKGKNENRSSNRSLLQSTPKCFSLSYLLCVVTKCKWSKQTLQKSWWKSNNS